MRKPGTATTLAGFVLVAILAACTPPDRTYVEHGPTGTSFAMPGGWELRDLQPDASNPYEIDDNGVLVSGTIGGRVARSTSARSRTRAIVRLPTRRHPRPPGAAPAVISLPPPSPASGDAASPGVREEFTHPALIGEQIGCHR